MGINILSQDKKTLVNYRNVVEISIVPKYMKGSIPEIWWEIIAYYSVADSYYVLNTILAKYDTEEECQKYFDILINEIANRNEFIAI